MHMADALVSPAIGGIMLAASAGAIAYSAYKCKDDLDEKKIPLMGVMGAVIFAGQMINFTIPGTGSSGHIGGGILLAALLGPFPAFLAITAVLLIQSLFFADGGLLALGITTIAVAARPRVGIVSTGDEVVPPDQPLPKLPVARAVWKPAPDLATSAEAWITAGGPHHTVMSTALTSEHLSDLAEMVGTELALIDHSTDLRRFVMERRWSQAYYRLAMGF